jgi:carbon starvation protein
MIFVGITTLTAGTMNIKNLFLLKIMEPASRIQGAVNLALTLIIMFCVVAIVADAAPRWLKGKKTKVSA